MSTQTWVLVGAAAVVVWLMWPTSASAEERAKEDGDKSEGDKADDEFSLDVGGTIGGVRFEVAV